MKYILARINTHTQQEEYKTRNGRWITDPFGAAQFDSLRSLNRFEQRAGYYWCRLFARVYKV
mgnify:CR=1 FL=1